MANSTPIQSSCVCVYASPGPLRRTKPNQDDQFIVEVSVSLAVVQKNPVRKFSPKIHQSIVKTFQHPRKVFLSATNDEQRDIIYNIIQGLETPFPLENINWGLEFPEKESKPESLDNIIAGKLKDIACRCAESDQIGYMDVRVRKLEKLKNEEYEELCAPEKQPLDDWILENSKNVNIKQHRYLWFIYKLGRQSPKGNKYYGLKSLKMEGKLGHEAGKNNCDDRCSICIKSFKKNSQAIRMPCSHVFHGFCIFEWLQKRPSCPLCRFNLFNSEPRDSIN